MAFNKESLIQGNLLELKQLFTVREFIKGLGDMGFFGEGKLTNSIIDQTINDADSILSNCMYDRNKYGRLVETLLYKNHDKLALKLDSSVIDMCDLNRCDPKLPFEKEFSFLKDDDQSYDINDQCNLTWNHKSDSNSVGTVYYMNPKTESFGFCLLINNYFTKGTYKEMQKFRNIFYQLNFDVIMEKNLTAQKIQDKLTEISQDERIKHHSAFIFMIITHGYADRTIEGFDGKSVQIDSLVSIMKNSNCEDLAGKPKIFFFNACRTDELLNLDWGVLAENPIQHLNNIQQLNHVQQLNNTQQLNKIKELSRISPVSTNGKILVSEEVDYLICFTTMQGFPAFVDRVSGTRFGAALLEVLIRRAWSYDIDKLLKRVLNALNQRPYNRPTDETINKLIQNSNDIGAIILELQQYSFPVFSIETTLPKHFFFNFKEKRSFV